MSKGEKSTIFRDIFCQKYKAPLIGILIKIIIYTFIQIDLAKKKVKIRFLLKAYLESALLIYNGLNYDYYEILKS